MSTSTRVDAAPVYGDYDGPADPRLLLAREVALIRYSDILLKEMHQLLLYARRVDPDMPARILEAYANVDALTPPAP